MKEEGKMKGEKLVWGDEHYSTNFNFVDKEQQQLTLFLGGLNI